MTDAPVFLPRPTYRLFSAGGAAVALLFAWELLNAFSLPVLFFLLAAAGFAPSRLPALGADASGIDRRSLGGVTVHAPLQAPLHILFRQMITCDEAGRIMPGLSLVYWPVSADGFVDTDAPRTLFLPRWRARRSCWPPCKIGYRADLIGHR